MSVDSSIRILNNWSQEAKCNDQLERRMFNDSKYFSLVSLLSLASTVIFQS